MLPQECRDELRASWLPHITDTGLARLVELLEQGSPLLIHGCFTRSVPMGCLATQAAWHHPRTCNMTLDAGINWLNRVAGLNPATSLVIREWDRRGAGDIDLRMDLVKEFRAEQERRAEDNLAVPVSGELQPV